MTVVIDGRSSFRATSSCLLAKRFVFGSEASSQTPVSQEPVAPLSEAFARDQDEEHAQCCIDEDRHGEDHGRPAGEKLADVRLPHPREVERGVLAVADEGEDGVERVLVRGKAVDADCEREDEL